MMKTVALLMLVGLVAAGPIEKKAEIKPVQQVAPPNVAPPKVAPPKVAPKAEEKTEWIIPNFCAGNECPVFSVTQQTGDYELRSYTHANWVSTQVEGMDYEVAGGEGFDRLFKFISGENDQNMKIDMTAPVARKISPGSGPNCETMFTTSFFIPYKLQMAPPAPTNADVYIELKQEMNVYVRSFPGYATIDDYLRNALELAEAIGDASLYHQEFYYTAGYDSPYNPFNRHNEVWFIGTF